MQTLANSHRLTEKVKLLQKVVLEHAGKFLILRRSSESATRPNLWDLPGGNSEWPVAQEDQRNLHIIDAVREVAEETGIKIMPEKLTENIYIGTYFEARKQVFTVILGWKLYLPTEFDESTVELSPEHSEFKWITYDEFASYDFGFAGEPGSFIEQMVVRAAGRTV